MRKSPTVADYMSRNLITFADTMPIADAVAQLLDRRISGAPVLGAGSALCGVITAKDCFKAALHACYYQGWSGVVGDFMTTDVHTMDADLDIVTAAQQFIQQSFRRFPVTRDGRLVGVITRRDLLRALNEQWG